MKISEVLDLKLRPGVHDTRFIDASGNDLTGKLKASDYEMLEVRAVSYELIAVITLKKA